MSILREIAAAKRERVRALKRLHSLSSLRDEPLYRLVVRAAFGQRRKMLRNALAALAGERMGRGGLEAVLAAAGVDPTARAETLDLAAFARITDALAAAP